jgi:outer membrane lipoprotein-sorting protein
LEVFKKTRKTGFISKDLFYPCGDGMKKIILIVEIILIIIVLNLGGCTQQTGSQESIETILEKASNVGPVYYEAIVTTSTEGGGFSSNYTSTMKVWQKMPYMKMEITSAGITQIMVFRPEGSYIYNDLTQNYTKYLPPNNETQQKFFEQQADEMLESQTLEVLGTDIIDGKAVTIVEYSYNVSGGTMSPKLWIWNEKGIPLRMETKSTIMGFTMIMTSENTNFIFGEIQDNVFDVS